MTSLIRRVAHKCVRELGKKDRKKVSKKERKQKRDFPFVSQFAFGESGD